jgi:hypothetical protein
LSFSKKNERYQLKKSLAAIAALALTVGFAVTAPAMSASAADVGVNMDQACQIQWGIGYQSILSNPSSAYGWQCYVAPWGVRKSVSVQGYCNYFSLGTAVVLDAGNPYSWRCRS